MEVAANTDNNMDIEVGNLADKLDKLFQNLDKKVQVPLHLNQNGVDFESKSDSDELKVENKTRQWYNPNILSQHEDDEISTKEIQKSNLTSASNSSGIKLNQNPNGFYFKFENRYDPIVEQNLYPKFYQKFKIGSEFVIQRTGSHRTICLTCQCELLMQRSNHNILNHISGQRHMRKLSNPTCAISLRNYHDIFYNLEPNLQAHQVYFVPDENTDLVKCVLCVLYVRPHEVQLHILNDPHKSKVISMRYDNSVKYSFYLLDRQLEVYGIEPDVKKAAEGSQVPPSEETQKRKIRGNQRKILRGSRSDGDVKPHEIVKSIEHPNDANPIKTLPRRFGAHENFLKTNGSLITCTACKRGRRDCTYTRKDIQLHLVQPSHLVSTKLSLQDYLYFCEICDMKFHDEMTWHIHFTIGPNKHGSMASSRKDKVCEHECLTCKVIIFGDMLSLKRHQNSFVRKIEKKKETIIPEDAKTYFCSKSVIIENGQTLLDDAQKVLIFQDDVLKCCQDMENALSVYFRRCKAYPFGSRISGLGSSDSDLDVFIDIGNMYEGIERQDEHNQFEIIRTTLELFRKKKEFYKITSRPTARTPIIKLKHRPTNLDCDISFRHGLSVENTKFLRFCFQLQPVSQELILLLKKWSHLCVLNENITTYAFAMMTIFYLQTGRYLISVKTLKELNPNPNAVIDGWETIAYTRPMKEIRDYVKICDKDIIQLLKGFFKFYSDFKYKTDVICPLMGEIVLKSQFTEDLKGGKLPKEMGRYIDKINHEEQPEYFRSLSEFCIQDPFDLSHNLTKACTPTIVEKFKKLCELSYEMLNKLED